MLSVSRLGQIFPGLLRRKEYNYYPWRFHGDLITPTIFQLADQFIDGFIEFLIVQFSKQFVIVRRLRWAFQPYRFIGSAKRITT
jgi:hypothetical protein